MSSLFKPVGPEDPKTYWRRRAIVIGGLLALVVAVVALLVALLGGGESEAAAAPDPEPTFGLSMSPIPDDAVLAAAPQGASGSPAPAGGTPAVTGSPAPTTSGSPSAAPSSAAHPVASTLPCADSAIQVAVAVASTTTPVGAGMGMTMTVTNIGTTACSRDIGPASTQFRITSGPALIWSSEHCDASTQADVLDLGPGESRTVQARWPGRKSMAGCPADMAIGAAGTYRAIAENGSVESGAVRFVVG